ncbi:pPIWI_RE module domain-containing protein [Streptomyces malaysiensis]|uniref:DUF3893 domain-containing protein n=1 Tax=Streptomyces autolyticus TaxID=75293 RepID=A0ABN4WC75_9ACTN|nr:DUF3962 domain-containing protein [Streptomyces autolyticus]AQA14847.1 hypothetical protein BV401_34980 [Streptomyces autolyticus]
MYPVIRTTSYEPDPETPWTEQYDVITFAERWRTELTELLNLGSKRRASSQGLPITRLNSLLTAAAPGVIALGRGAAADSDAPWIYAREKVPERVIAPLFNTWVMGLLPGEDLSAEQEDKLAGVLDVINAHPPQWRVERVDLTAGERPDGGTVEPDRRLYGLLPERIAARLAARPLRISGTSLTFRVVSRRDGTEMVSWPPRRYATGNRTWYYSARVGITVQTVPFTERFRVHVSTSIRRWITHTPVPLHPTRGATVLFDVPTPWADADTSRSRLVANTMGYSPRLGRTAWRRHSLVELLPELDIVRSYPKPDNLITGPEEWINGIGDIAAGVIHSTSTGKHGVGAGLMPAERALLNDWVEAGMRPFFRRVPDLTRATRLPRPALLPALPARDQEKAAVARREHVAARRTALAKVLDSQPLRIDILWHNPETRDQLLEDLRTELGVPAVPGDGLVRAQLWEIGPLRIDVRLHEFGPLTAALEVERKKDVPRPESLATATQLRMAAVSDFLGPRPPGRALALVEIAGEGRFEDSDTDPKFALRLGCAQAGRLSQFIVAPEDSEGSLPHRSNSAVLDGLRHLGAITFPDHRLSDDVPDDLQYVALWVVRRNAAGPTRRAARRLVAVRLRPRDAVHPITCWNDERRTWVPYAQHLLDSAFHVELAGTDAEVPIDDATANRVPGNDRQRAEVERRIRALLFTIRDTPTLLIANSGNMRDSWYALRNGGLRKDMIRFGTGPEQRLATYGTGLRFVLVRDANSRDEVPQWYAPSEGDSTPGLSQGLWAPPDADADHRVFVSTAGMSKSGSGLTRGLMKLVPDADWPTAPSKTAWNPRYLELTVLGCLSTRTLAAVGAKEHVPDRPVTWAALTHQLRFPNGYEQLTRPLPMHLAKLVEEYVLPLEPHEAD